MTDLDDSEIDWSAAIAAHASFAVRVYDAGAIGSLAREAKLTIRNDGSNTASCEADVKRYIEAVETTLGTVAGVSAALTVKNKIRELRR